MQKEDPKAYATLQEHFADIARSNVDPADLARDLFSAKIIGKARVEEATHPLWGNQDLKRQHILNEVMNSGRLRAFQDFVLIILKMEQCSWLGKRLMRTYMKLGGKWDANTDLDLESDGFSDYYSNSTDEDLGIITNCYSSKQHDGHTENHIVKEISKQISNNGSSRKPDTGISSLSASMSSLSLSRMESFIASEFQDICCAGCNSTISKVSCIFKLRGHKFRLERVNPHGYHHEFITVRGITCQLHLDSDETEEHTWFSGYMWTIISCSNCSSHLGWRFQATEKQPKIFFGLRRKAVMLSASTSTSTLSVAGIEDFIAREFHQISCAGCNSTISNVSRIFQVRGHEFRLERDNPYGYHHVFITVTGITCLPDLDSDETEEHTWFPEYMWTIICCRKCLLHLGWRYRATKTSKHPQTFFGLSCKAIMLY